jgi:hypothetical protein
MSATPALLFRHFRFAAGHWPFAIGERSFAIHQSQCRGELTGA